MARRYYVITEDDIIFAGDNEILGKKLLDQCRKKQKKAILLSLNKGLIGSTYRDAWRVLGDMDKESLLCKRSDSA